MSEVARDLGISESCLHRWRKQADVKEGFRAEESFFALLHRDVLNTERWSSREELRPAIVNWIECTYHRGRRQRLGKLTPIEFETPHEVAHAA